MAASGYLLQVAVDPGWRQTWTWVHVASSLLWVMAFVVHQTVAWVAKRSRGMVEVDQTLQQIVNE
jgi:thiosulfate reductase cytochrome b subunit